MFSSSFLKLSGRFAVTCFLVCCFVIQPFLLCAQATASLNTAGTAADPQSANTDTVQADIASLSTQSAQTLPEDSAYVDDQASLIRDSIRAEIIKNCREIEEKTRIRFLIKTTTIKQLSDAQSRIDTFFSEWIRSIGLEKRGILVYACLPEGAAHGKVYLRVGIGLKYLISREMGEKILNQIIVPNNAANNDGLGFLEGVRAVKRMLLDELKRSSARATGRGHTFSPGSFLWASKEIILVILICTFLCYVIFFVERCPRCNGVLKVTSERLKEPGTNTLGLQRKIYSCERCGFSRRKKEPLYPSGKAGWIMRLTGARRNVKIE